MRKFELGPSSLIYNKNYNLPFTSNNIKLKYISIVIFVRKLVFEIFNSHWNFSFLIYVLNWTFVVLLAYHMSRFRLSQSDTKDGHPQKQSWWRFPLAISRLVSPECHLMSGLSFHWHPTKGRINNNTINPYLVTWCLPARV